LSTQYKSNLDYLKNYLVVAERVKEIMKLLDPSAKIYVSGSVVRGLYTASSDIDILVITENVNLKYDIMVGFSSHMGLYDLMCFHRFIFVPLHPARVLIGLGGVWGHPRKPHILST